MYIKEHIKNIHLECIAIQVHYRILINLKPFYKGTCDVYEGETCVSRPRLKQLPTHTIPGKKWMHEWSCKLCMSPMEGYCFFSFICEEN